MNWQQQAQAYLQETPDYAAQLYEQAIESEPTVMEYYWYLGLAYLLGDRVEEAQATWFWGLMEFPEDEFRQGLGQVLAKEAERQRKQGNFELSRTLRWQLGEILPENFENLLHLVELSVQLRQFNPTAAESQQLIESLKQNAGVSIKFPLLTRVLEPLLKLPNWKVKPLLEATYIYLQSLPQWSPENLGSREQRVLGAVYIRLGELETGIELLKSLLALQSDDAETIEELGRASEAKGELEVAKNYYQKALALDETRASSWNCLGEVQVNQEQFEAALSSFQQAITIDPHYTLALQNLGLIYKQQGESETAISYFEKVLEIDPSYWHASFYIGNIYLRQCQASKGIPILEKALVFNQEEALLHNGFGMLWKALGHYEKAVNCFKKALAIDSTQAIIYSNLGGAYLELDNEQEAMIAYQNALELNPNEFKAHFGLGGIYQRFGEFEKARKSLQQAIAINPNSTGPYFFLFRQSKASREDPYFQQLLELAQKTKVTADDKQLINFALAKAWHDIGDYREAFRYLKQANDLKRSEFDYCVEDIENYFKLIKENFDFKIITNKSLKVNLEITPIFIVGMPRSGTTLAKQIISSHTQVTGLGELTFLHHISVANEHNLIKKIKSTSINTLEEARQFYFKKVSELHELTPFFSDKMPHNFFRIGLIKILFPEAKVIHCLRHPLDTCLSIYQQL